MSESQATNSSKPYDPLEPFRGMRDAYLDAMAKTMVEAVNSEAYAQATGAMLDSTLTMSAPFRESLEKSMLQVLQQLSLPSRQEIVALAERFTNVEMRLDDMDALLDGFESKLKKSTLPVLEQLMLLTQIFTNIVERLDRIDARLNGLPAVAGVKPAAVGSKPKTRIASKARANGKRAGAGKTAELTKRVARGRAR